MRRVRVLTAAALLATGCHASAPRAGDSGPVIVQPGAPGEPSRPISAADAAGASRIQVTPADIRFMQGMIGHHAQAVEMAGLVPTHTSSEDLRKLAERIDVSQRDEIAFMTSWLRARGQDVPSPHAMHKSGATAMPGMLTPEEMSRLAAASGPVFDRLFLQGMITHHGGALTMVHDLFATPGAGQDPEVFAFASDIDADQRMEIDRMRAMLDARR
jgi:uncharacterized protein (DUF305 family)